LHKKKCSKFNKKKEEEGKGELGGGEKKE